MLISVLHLLAVATLGAMVAHVLATTAKILTTRVLQVTPAWPVF